MKQRRHFKTKEERGRAHQLWEEEIRQKAVRVIKSYQVTLEVERTWQVARSLFSTSLPKRPEVFYSTPFFSLPERGR